MPIVLAFAPSMKCAITAVGAGAMLDPVDQLPVRIVDHRHGQLGAEIGQQRRAAAVLDFALGLDAGGLRDATEADNDAQA
jgi:hypothetical protein